MKQKRIQESKDKLIVFQEKRSKITILNRKKVKIPLCFNRYKFAF